MWQYYRSIGFGQNSLTDLPTRTNSIIIKKRNLPKKINESIPVINQPIQSEQPIKTAKQIDTIDSSNNLISPSLQPNKKVRYDHTLNKIILEPTEEQYSDIILDKRFDLFELRDLIKKNF